MNNGLKAAAAGMVLAMAGGVASADVVVTSLVGDIDGFGLNSPGSVVVQQDQIFDPFDVYTSAIPDGDGTDELIDKTTVNHVYSFAGNILSATLTLFHGGWGWGQGTANPGPARVSINNVEIGLLTDGEVLNLDTGLVDNYARKDTFVLDLGAHPGLLTGNDVVSIVSVPPSNIEFDDGVLDYSLLTITTDAQGGTPVPEPGSIALVALALGGLAASRRRRQPG